MDKLLTHRTKLFSEEIERISTVTSVVNDMISIVESHSYINEIERLKQKNSLSNLTLKYFTQYISKLEDKNEKINKELTTIKNNTRYTKEKFILESSRLLIDSKKIKSLRSRIDELELTLANLKSNQPITSTSNINSNSSNINNTLISTTTTESSSTSSSVPSSASSTSTSNNNISTIKPYIPPNPRLLYDLSDEAQLLVFSFLETNEVLAIAQVCRKAYKRIDSLFGMESSIITPEWDLPPPRGPPPSLSASNASTPSIGSDEFKLSRESLDILTKKLNAQEMKIILSLTDKIKKQVQALDQQQVLNDDLTARLENTESVRDFLIDKLKSAELAIKSMISEISTLKKQNTNDNEIISYLDLKVQELENENSEYLAKISMLQTSLDLQIGTHSVREDQLKVELNDYKNKYEKLDRDSKAQKKALVKEVKSLRQQLETLTNEKTAYAYKLQQLREAFDSH